MATNAESGKGAQTVQLLQLDRREALNDGYLKTWRRLVATVDSALQQEQLDSGELATALREADDHGLLGWCFAGTGRSVKPFSTLRTKHSVIWDACVSLIAFDMQDE